MKKIFLTSTLFAFISLVNPANSQISIGAKGGLNVSNLSGLNDLQGVEANSLVGFHLGGFVTFNLGRNIAIQPELLFSTQGAKVEDVDDNLTLNYLNIPVMVKLLTNSGFYVEAGPQFGFKTNKISNDYDDLEEEFENSDVSACLGLGFQPTKSAFGIGARYNLGLTTLAELQDMNDNNVDIKSGVFQLSLYWRIFGGGKLKK